MFDAHRESKTICALASAVGHAAISVIRLSGPEAFLIIKKACPGLSQKKLKSHTAYLSKFFNSQNIFIDQVLVTTFEHGKSYTGEESVEISCHGSQHITKKILESLIHFGATAALKGEFTYRAFMNDKIDLIQAEAVLSVIESQSDSSLKMSLRQLEGAVSDKFITLEDQLTWCLAHIEASIDFSSEGIDVVDPDVLIAKLKEIKNSLLKLTQSFDQGRLIKNGIKLVLAGQPNVGKSSLFNKLIQTDKAIVTAIAGTTRDVVESQTSFNGLVFNVSDTAGLRETDDQVEKIGVEKSKQEILNADLTLFVFDNSLGLLPMDIQKINQTQGKILLLGNKSDKNKIEDATTIRQKLHDLSSEIELTGLLSVSALDVSARELILTKIADLFQAFNFEDDSVISSARQHELALVALENIEQATNELVKNLGAEFVAQTLKEALMAFQKIVGRYYDDQILDRVFKEFCLGK